MPGEDSKSWTDHVETMGQTWAKAQQEMWTNWFNFVQATPISPPLSAGIVDQWYELAKQGLEAWLAGAEPTAKDVARQLFASQEVLMRFLELSAEAWQSMATKVESGQDWPSVLAEYVEQLRQQLLFSPEKMAQAGQETGELWQLYWQELQNLTLPWLKSFQQAPGHVGQATTGNGSALLELTNLYWDAYERTFGRLLESPGLGYTRELDEKILKGFDAWQDFRRVSIEYQVILAEAWVQIFEKLMRELVALAEKGEAIQSLGQLVSLWNNVADSVLLNIFRSEKYIRVQGQLLNAAMNYRVQRREIIELFSKIYDLPTRCEVDEAHRNIYEQRREVKVLKKSMNQVQTALASIPSPDEIPTRAELNEVHQTLQALQAEVKSLQETINTISPAAKPQTKSRKSPSRRKPAGSKPATSNQGGE